MEVKLGVLADYASITREGKLNILGIFDVITPKAFPVALPIFFVVVSYEAGVAEFRSDKNIEIVLSDEDGAELLRLPQMIKVVPPSIAGTTSTVNHVAGIVGFPFQKSGAYQFDILVNGESKTRIPLRVNAVQQKK